MLLRYKDLREDLRAETLEALKHIHSALEIPVGKRELAGVLESRSYENIPKEKGKDTLRRKATPRGWSEDLTPEQIEVVEREAAQTLNLMPKAGVSFSKWLRSAPFAQLQARWLATRIAQGRKHDP